VVAAADLIEAVAGRLAEVVVGIADVAIQLELDGRLRATDGL